MAIPVRWRRLRWRRASRGSLRPWVTACALAPLAMVALATGALARAEAPGPNAALLPSALPTVCVGGVLVCGGSVVTQPTPCVAGALCSPLPVPSVCVSGACTGTVIGPAPTQSPGGNPTGSRPPGPTSAPQTAAPLPGNGGITAAAVTLPAPPGVGLVPALTSANQDVGLNPDAFATVLSLSMRDGLLSSRYHVWPWLLAVQLVIWTAIAAYFWLRDQGSSSPRLS